MTIAGRAEHFLTSPDKRFRVVVMDASTPDITTPPCAAIFGEPEDGCLVRIHSRCLYSEAFRSEDCDCRAQLERTLDLIHDKGAGIIIYLDQEGRGLGLLAKAHGVAYSQATGKDTYASYADLGFQADARNYTVAAKLITDLGLTQVRLLTNNPDKMAALKEYGIEVEQEPLVVSVGESARPYLEAKRARGHHLPAAPQPPESNS
jgi:GTP cyclohydrolase II